MAENAHEIEILRQRVSQFLAFAHQQAYLPDGIDYSPCYHRQENRSFMALHGIMQEDIRNFILDLALGQFSHISMEEGKTDAYVFGFRLPWDGTKTYMKLKECEGVLVLSLHSPERDLRFPFQNEEDV